MKPFALIGLVATYTAFCLPGAAQVVGDPAGPRTGTVFELQVSLTDSAQIEELDNQGYNIGHVAGTDYATIYATPAERGDLIAAGYDVTTVATQPSPLPFEPDAKGLGVYHNYASLTSELQDYAANFPSITSLISLGQSVQGRELWAMLITDNPGVEEAEPEFKYVSTMHGDEPVGTEMCLYFIDRLLNDYGTDSRITGLIDTTAIWIVPLMNPDGLEAGSRFNANGFDLNRSFPAFPDDFIDTIYDGETLGDAGRPPEVEHVMQWTAQHSFVLSANIHTGSLVVNYPYDEDIGIATGMDAPTPDDALFEAISLEYSTHNSPMYNSFVFPNGITNGSDWYSIDGGMQDWNYRFVGCKEVTLEISQFKAPLSSQLPNLWADNEESMLSYLESVHRGVRGVVTDDDTGAPLWAQVIVDGNPQRVFTDPDVGDYYRLLEPGTYDLLYMAPGYQAKLVKSVAVGSGGATNVDVQLVALNLPVGSSSNVLMLTAAAVLLLGTAVTGAWARRRSPKASGSSH